MFVEAYEAATRGHALSDTMAKRLVDAWCADPEIWATHGLPGEAKLARIEHDIAEALASVIGAATAHARMAGYSRGLSDAYRKPRP